jgi:hypothetical protein
LPPSFARTEHPTHYRPGSVHSDRAHRIDAGRPARGQVRREQRNDTERQPDRDERERIQRSDAEQHALQEAGAGRGAGEPEGQAGDDERQLKAEGGRASELEAASDTVEYVTSSANPLARSDALHPSRDGFVAHDTGVSGSRSSGANRMGAISVSRRSSSSSTVTSRSSCMCHNDTRCLWRVARATADVQWTRPAAPGQ